MRTTVPTQVEMQGKRADVTWFLDFFSFGFERFGEFLVFQLGNCSLNTWGGR